MQRVQYVRNYVIVVHCEMDPLAELLELGFEASQCASALQRCGGSRDAAIELLLSGDVPSDANGHCSSSNERVTQLEVSQYTLTDRSSSACTSIAWTFIAEALEALERGDTFDNNDRLTGILLEGVSSFESVSSISGGAHLSVEEFVNLLPTDKNCKMCGPSQQNIFSEINVRDFLNSVSNNSKIDSSRPIGVVITKPPETIAVLISRGSFFFFDSHSRPQLGIEGAYLVECDGIEGLVHRILLVFHTMECSGDDMIDMMYNLFEGTTFQYGV